MQVELDDDGYPDHSFQVFDGLVDWHVVTFQAIPTKPSLRSRI